MFLCGSIRYGRFNIKFRRHNITKFVLVKEVETMGYSKFKKIRNVVKKFNLELQSVQLFGEIEKVEPSSWLQETLKMADVSLLTSEKAKSERLISPILVEVFQAYKLKISFFSGEQLNIRPNDDLAGECDFFFSLHPTR